MMSVLIECGEDAVALSATLTTLVPGAVEGLVREVLMVDRGLDTATRKVADHAGCRIVAAGEAAQALAAAKGDWIMLVEPGARLSAGWIEAVAEHFADAAMGNGVSKAARFAPAPGEGGWLARFRHRRRSSIRFGLIAPKAQVVEFYRRGGVLGKPPVRQLAAVIRPRSEAR